MHATFAAAHKSPTTCAERVFPHCARREDPCWSVEFYQESISTLGFTSSCNLVWYPCSRAGDPPRSRTGVYQQVRQKSDSSPLPSSAVTQEKLKNSSSTFLSVIILTPCTSGVRVDDAIQNVVFCSSLADYTLQQRLEGTLTKLIYLLR